MTRSAVYNAILQSCTEYVQDQVVTLNPNDLEFLLAKYDKVHEKAWGNTLHLSETDRGTEEKGAVGSFSVIRLSTRLQSKSQFPAGCAWSREDWLVTMTTWRNDRVIIEMVGTEGRWTPSFKQRSFQPDATGWLAGHGRGEWRTRCSRPASLFVVLDSTWARCPCCDVDETSLMH